MDCDGSRLERRILVQRNDCGPHDDGVRLIAENDDPHPRETLLCAYAEGSLPKDVARGVLSHAVGCRYCFERLVRVLDALSVADGLARHYVRCRRERTQERTCALIDHEEVCAVVCPEEVPI